MAKVFLSIYPQAAAPALHSSNIEKRKKERERESRNVSMSAYKVKSASNFAAPILTSIAAVYI